jgi:Icc-related predicted phosphoesterase
MWADSFGRAHGGLLAGDFYKNPDLKRRGTTGDVEEVWISYAERFRWVAGVAGNHDLFAGKDSFGNVFRRHVNVHPLDGALLEIDGLRVGGISGIFGTPGRKPWRHDYGGFEETFIEIMAKDPDILLLHEGPDFPTSRLRGSAFIRELLEATPAEARPALVLNGHCHWPKPVVELGDSGPTVMNVDARAVMLVRG